MGLFLFSQVWHILSDCVFLMSCIKLHSVKSKVYVETYEFQIKSGKMFVTWMHAYTDPQRDARQVQQFKCLDKTQHVQGHVGDVHRMPVAVAVGQTRCHHVRVSNRLNLKDERQFGLFLLQQDVRQNTKIPCRRRGGQECYQSSCRCRWACRPLPWVCCSGRVWWSPQCHWSRWWPPQTALAPLCPTPSGSAPPGWGTGERWQLSAWLPQGVPFRGEKTSTKSRKNFTSSTDSNLFIHFILSSIRYAVNPLPLTSNGSTSEFFKVQNSLSLSGCLKWLIMLTKEQFAWS